MRFGTSIAIGVASGIALIVVVLLSAFATSGLNPEGGDSWGAVYFFTHPAFFALFAVDLTVGFIWRFRKSKPSTQL